MWLSVGVYECVVYECVVYECVVFVCLECVLYECVVYECVGVCVWPKMCHKYIEKCRKVSVFPLT